MLERAGYILGETLVDLPNGCMYSGRPLTVGPCAENGCGSGRKDTAPPSWIKDAELMRGVGHVEHGRHEGGHACRGEELPEISTALRIDSEAMGNVETLEVQAFEKV